MGQMLTGGPGSEARQLACPKGFALSSRLDSPAHREGTHVLDESIAFPVHAKCVLGAAKRNWCPVFSDAQKADTEGPTHLTKKQN